MKSFLENRHSVTGNATSALGKVSVGQGFQKLGSFHGSAGQQAGASAASAGQPSQPAEVLANPNDPDAPKVEFVREGEVIRRIIVSFGEKKVEIDCQY